MLNRMTLTLCAFAVSGALVGAQAPAPQSQAATTKPAQAAPAVAKTPPEPPPLAVNIKIEVAITDQAGSNPAAKKVVTMIASDRNNVNVRSSASVPVRTSLPGSAPGSPLPQSYTYKTVQINVDARPSIVQKEGNKIALNFGLEYLPTTRLSAQEEGEPGLTSWNERLSVILESGKPMVVSQAADPTSDRKITVEVTATILK